MIAGERAGSDEFGSRLPHIYQCGQIQDFHINTFRYFVVTGLSVADVCIGQGAYGRLREFTKLTIPAE